MKSSLPEPVRGEMESRLRFETFLADCSARFVAGLTSSIIDAEITRALEALLRVLPADGCALFGGTPADGGVAWLIGAAHADRRPPVFSKIDFAASFPWLFHRTLASKRQAVALTLDELPASAVRDRKSAAAMGLRSMLAAGVAAGDRGGYCLVAAGLSDDTRWPASHTDRVQVLVRVFADALGRKYEQDTRQQIEGSAYDLLQSVGVIVWRADAATFQTTFISEEAETLLGYPVESWLRVPNFWLDHVHPDDRDWVVAFSGEAAREHRPHDFEYRMIVADGRVIWLRNIVKVVVRNGEAVELAGVTANIDERKRAEFEAARLRHELIPAGRVMIAAELAATLAHELNQPLGAIVSDAEAALLLLNRDRPALDQVQPILEDVIQEGQRAGAVLHRVRRLLQKEPVPTQLLDISQLVEAVLGLTRPLALTRGIEISADIPRELPRPSGDPVQIEQVLLNLIFNAIDAVAARAEGRRRISIGASNREAGVALWVSDTGTGVRPENQERVFEPFFTTKPGGMGMGLAICRTIVRSHDGEIWIENVAEGGATVLFTLPVRDGPIEG